MKETYEIAFNVAVDWNRVPYGVDLPTEVTYGVRAMVLQETTGLWGVTFDMFTVNVTNGGSNTLRITFQVTVDDPDWPGLEITRRAANMINRYLARSAPSWINFDPATLIVTTVADQTTPAPVKVKFSHETTPEPVAAAPAKRGWRRLFGRS